MSLVRGFDLLLRRRGGGREGGRDESVGALVLQSFVDRYIEHFIPLRSIVVACINNFAKDNNIIVH